MAGYKEIKGFQVQTRSEDPTPYAQALSDNPYAGTWSAGGDLNDSRYSYAGAGTQTAAIVFGGDAPGNTGNTETYNGSSWTEVSDLNTARQKQPGGNGTYTSALCSGGYTTTRVAVVESWDGSSWTETGDLNTARSQMAAAGASNTSALVFGGTITPRTAATEQWN